MNPELPPHLHPIRDLLKGSLHTHPTDQAAVMPADLLADLTNRFQTPALATAHVPSSWFERIQSFVSRPAFGVAALAVVILGLALPSLIAPTPTGSGFRGTTAIAPGESVRIILVQAPAGIRTSLETSGDFETGAISSISGTPAGQSGSHVVVDFVKSEISAIAADGTVISTDALPADSAALSAAIATAVSRL